MPKPPLNTRQLRKRRETIIVAAMKLAAKPGGWMRLTRAAIAIEASCSDGLVSNYLGSMASVRRILVRSAIKQENFDILVQALTAGDPEALKMCPMLRAKSLDHLQGA